MISSIILSLLKIEIRPHVREQAKKQQRNYDLLSAEIKSKFLVYRIKDKEKNYRKKSFLRKRGNRDLNKKRKKKAF